MSAGSVSQEQAAAAVTIFNHVKADAWIDHDGDLRIACRGDRRDHVLVMLGEPIKTVALWPGKGRPAIYSLIYKVAR